jgi:cholesterol transport system auxiliary component
VALAATLGGCVTLLPSQPPIQTWRFEAASFDIPRSKAPASRVRLAPLSFDRAAGGDRILTITGSQAAYIGGARWVTAAPTLFEAAVTAAFDRSGGPARLLAPGEPSPADYSLKLDVRTFVTRYVRGPHAPPVVVVRLYAALVQRANANLDQSQLFEGRAEAASNSVHAIISAYDSAVTDALKGMVAWVETHAAA